jgi:hypothetical protein
VAALAAHPHWRDNWSVPSVASHRILSSVRWILTAALVCVLVVVLVWRVRVDPQTWSRAETDSAEFDTQHSPSELSTATLAVDAPVSRTPIEAARAVKPEPDASEPEPPRDDIVALFEGLGLPRGYWHAFSNFREFGEFDLSRVRRLVREHGIQFPELMGAYHRVGPRSELRPVLVIAAAFCSKVRGVDLDELQRLASADHDNRRLSQGLLPAGSSYAGTLALWMLDGQEQLRSAAYECLPRYLDQSSLENFQTRVQFLRDTAALSLDALDSASGAELHRSLRRALDAEPEMLISEAAWRLHGRSAGKDARLQLLDQAVAGPAYARFAIEDIRDESFTPNLEAFARAAPGTVWGDYLGESACIALINIGTPKSWRAFERILLEEQTRSYPWEAVGNVVRPKNLANLLNCASRWTRAGHDDGVRGVIRPMIEQTRARLDRCTVPRSVVRHACVSLSMLVSDGSLDVESLGCALRVLATHGDEGDRRLVLALARELPDTAASQVYQHIDDVR